MGLVNTLGRFADKYRRDVGGQFAVITAMVGLPLLLLSAAAVDINRAHGQNAGLQSALDAAALAAVIPDNMSNSERYAYAETVFEKNYFGGLAVDLDVGGDRELVTIEATAKVPTMISGVVGIDTVEVTEDSAAELTKADVVCILALDPYSDRALEFKDQATFKAPACSVQVNSVSPFAMVSDVVTPPHAQSFCVAGISQGVFSPFVKNACSPIADPYANLPLPVNGPCETDKNINSGVTVLSPGTFCKGLNLQSGTVHFLPGTYIITTGKLEFRKGIIATGEGVTFVLKDDAHLEIEKDAQVSLKAPSVGPYAGLVFYQTNTPTLGKGPKFPNGKNTITSGGSLSLVGTAYFPTQELVITSDSPVISQSPATSFIAYRIQFAGKSNTLVRVDHEAGGLPPLLPRSDDGARLVSHP